MQGELIAHPYVKVPVNVAFHSQMFQQAIAFAPGFACSFLACSAIWLGNHSLTLFRPMLLRPVLVFVGVFVGVLV